MGIYWMHRIMNMDVIIPGLLWLDKDAADYIYKDLNLNNLNKLLQYSTIEYLNYSYSDLYYYQENFNNDLTYAQNLAKLINVNKLFTGFLIAQPTHMKYINNSFKILDAIHLQLSQSESQSIIKELNEYFNNTIKFFYVDEVTWLLGHNIKVDNKFYPLIQIIEEDVRNYLVDCDSNLLLNKMITDMQIYLFNASINLLRKQHNKLSINNIWIWDKSINNQFKSFNNDQKKISIDNLKDFTVEVSGHNIFIDELYSEVKARNLDKYINKLEYLDATLFNKLASLLQEKKSQEINIFIPQVNNTIKLRIKKNIFKLFKKNLKLINIVKEVYGK